MGYSDNVVYPSVVRKQITQVENRFTTYLLLIYFVKSMFFSSITLREVRLFHVIKEKARSSSLRKVLVMVPKGRI